MKITRKTFDEVMFPCYIPMNMVIKKAHGSYVLIMKVTSTLI